MTTTPLTVKDYASNQEVRWCPGCGDYAILKAVTKTLADLQLPREQTVFVSGIGCASRFPYYVSTYGFHTIHGRAPAIATGIKLANPSLDIWVVMGDGDSLSIGGNHTMHVLRRNVDLTLLLFNNEIYGLTKGQASPTSRRGTRSPSTPRGSIDTPIAPGAFALGAGARFFARGVDVQQAQLVDVMTRAHAHRGAALVEIFQNCVVFNDGVFDEFTARPVVDDNQLYVKHGQPLRFGKGGVRGLRVRPGTLLLEVVTPGEDGVTDDDILVHDEKDLTLAGMLVQLKPPIFPVAVGVIYDHPARTYEADLMAEVESELARGQDFAALLASGQTWER
ncbi:MAG: 2-oxoacid:ferredoxin oxidoreductase subunit beta [Gemmatimonadales bacterium]|nr:2-oxoacid:ferredoxin oxidoreductase subunit beta [Gemmatimonadales bacterium]